MKAGASHGENSAGAADQTALANCRRNGPTDCKILMDASNRCLALALGSNGVHYGYSPGSDRKSAAAGAMVECRSRGGVNCVLIAAPCAEDDSRWSAPLPLPTGVQASPRGSKNGGDLGTTDQSRVLDLESGGKWHLRISQRGEGWRSDARRHIHFKPILRAT